MFFSTMGGCSIMRPEMPSLASIEGVSGHFFIGQIIHTDTGDAISFDQLIDQLGSRGLIFIGEVHDNPEHHLIQIQILQALMARYGHITVAMEFFQEPQQSIIDRYMDGESTESVFLKDVSWSKNWSFDYHFYRPLILMAKKEGSKVLAINAPGDIVKKVARSGLNGLDPNERVQLASRIDLSNESHRAYLLEVYKEDAHQDLRNFDYFYQAQCVWEDTMAENIAEYLKENKETIVAFTGNGHIINKFGIPDRALGRIPVDMATIVLYPLAGQLTVTKETADYIWLTDEYPRRRSFAHLKDHHN
jgi:uncharacterized iron-regulated protein